MNNAYIPSNNPSIIRFNDLTKSEVEDLNKFLTYESKKNKYNYQRFKNNIYLKTRMGIKAHSIVCDKLKSEIEVNLLQKDDLGFYTYSGLSERLSKLNFNISNFVVYPEPKLIPWLNKPKFILRQYQEEFISALIKQRHGIAELATGAGKSLGLLVLVKNLGLQTVVMTPSENICNQLYKLFCDNFGKKYIGKYGAGKKEFNKLITITISASLTRLTPEDEAYKVLSKASVFAVDEAHLCPAETLAKVCFGLCSQAQYRFFVSGTNIRNDGADLLLEAIVGKEVYNLGSEELINKKILAKPYFYIINTESDKSYYSKDAMKMIREHYLYNKNVYQNVGHILTKIKDKQILILIDELEQYECIKSELTKYLPNVQNCDMSIELAQGGSDTSTLVENFNQGKFRILIGTSAISTGTDLFPDILIMLQGGKSPIKFRQSIGRGLRATENKSEIIVFDFNVSNVELLNSHCEERIEIYRSIYDNVQFLEKF